MKKKLYNLVFICLFPLFVNSQGIIPFSETLDINNVQATVHSNGNYFWDMMGSTLYFVPVDSGNSTLYSISPWIAGLDSNDSLHLAAMRYEGQEFLPGPIVDINQFNDTLTASQYNTIWKINREQIDEFKSEWDLGNVSNGTYVIPDVILTWPGDHPVLNDRLAPFIDLNQDGNYNPMDGDYPDIKGDQMLWWVYNDNTNHTSSGGRVLGVEYRVSFYAYYYANPPNDSIDAINYTTLLNFEIVNRSTEVYDSTMIGLYADFDIGNPGDDYIGCHVDFNSFYGYNGDNIDDPFMGNAYGGPIPPPPSQSMTLLNGPKADINDGIDNNRDGNIDELDECWGLTNFINFGTNYSTMGDPGLDIDFYNYMQSIWLDETPLVYGLNGYMNDTSITYIETDYAFPYDSDPMGWGQNGIVMPPWKENEAVNPPGDRKGVGSSGPFTFDPGEVMSLDYAFSFAWADTGTAFTSVIENMENVSDIIEWYENNNFPSSYTYGIENTQLDYNFLIFPNPANNKIIVETNDVFSKLYIYSQMGQLLEEINCTETRITIDVSGYSPGSYFIRSVNKNHVKVSEFVIVR